MANGRARIVAVAPGPARVEPELKIKGVAHIDARSSARAAAV